MFAQNLFTEGFTARFLKELCPALPTGRKTTISRDSLERRDIKPEHMNSSEHICPERQEHSPC